MVKVLVGDLFESKAQTWVNTINCVGVMGKGVALEFKNRFPDMCQRQGQKSRWIASCNIRDWNGGEEITNIRDSIRESTR